MENKTLAFALDYLQKGYSVIPLKPSENDDIGKKPYIFSWIEFQTRKPTTEEINEWWSKWPNAMIGLVCGQMAGFMVMDTDSKEQDDELQGYFSEGILTPIAITPSGGKHYYFKYASGVRNSNGTSGYKFHVRGEGGYVVAPPSVRIKKGQYRWVDGLELDSMTLAEAPEPLVNILLKQGFYIGTTKGEPQETTTTTDNHSFFKYGKRDDHLFHTANLMTKGGGESEFISEVLGRIIFSWGENPDPKWINAKVKSALDRLERKERNIMDEVLCFAKSNMGTTWKTTDCHNELQVTTKNEKKAVGMALCRLKDKGIIENASKIHGCYQTVNQDLEEIDWEGADDAILKIDMPFQINNWVELMPKNIVVIAGVQNAGKTCFLLNLALMNMDKYKILYFSSEMEGPELKKRLKKFECPLKRWKGVNFYKKEEDFAKNLDPNGLNIIDFLEITDKFYLIAERLREYHKRLDKGVLFVAIQKDPQKEYGRGGNLGLEKPRLYINIDPGKLRIIKAKNWATDVNPNGMEWKFKLVQGSKFIIMEETKTRSWHEKED